MKKQFQWMMCAVLFCGMARATEIKHRFLAFDEAGHQLVYVDENDASANWKFPLEGKVWDIQLVGSDLLSLPMENGYYLFDLKSRALKETVKVPGLERVWSLRHLADGRKIAIGTGEKGGMVATEISADNRMLREALVPNASWLRFGRVTAEGHALTAPNSEVIEWDLDGKIIKRFTMPMTCAHKQGLNAFMALKDENGNYLVSCGYGAMFVTLSPEGNVLQKFTTPEGSHYYGGFQRLPNGHIMQTNWCGHSPKKAGDGPQLLEFNQAGEVVWSYHNTNALSCPVSVIILDQLDTKKPAGDQSGLLKNF